MPLWWCLSKTFFFNPKTNPFIIFFVHVFLPRSFLEIHNIFMIFEVDYKKAEYLAFFKSTLTNVYPHVKKASSLMCPLSKNLCLTTMVTKKLTPNRDCHVSPKNVGAGLQLLYRIVVGKENGVQTTWLHHTVQ